MQRKFSCRGIFLVLSFVSLASISTVAQQLPLDPAIRSGRLQNGFTYYIRRNTTEKGHAVLYLVNKVGSILETDEQQGLAHFMEHMSFNGTTHFPGNKLVDYLEKAGVRFGADLNAYTDYDATVYQLPIPFDQPELIQNGLQIMRDWAQEALLENTEIDKERGVVLEEKRLREGAQKRMQDQYFSTLLNNSRYARRSPIGTTGVLVNFKPATLRSFYHDWYRPDLQSLIVVGDLDVDDIEKKIKNKFSDLKNPVNEKKRTEYQIELQGINHFTTVTDKENPTTVVQVIIKHPEKKNSSTQDYRDGIVRSLFNQMAAARFQEIARQQDPGYLSAGMGINHFMADLDAFSASVTTKPEQLEKSFKSFWTIISNIKKQGFTESELSRAKMNLSAGINGSLDERDKIPSSQYAQEYTRYILEGDSSPGIQEEADLVHEFLPGIALQDLNQLAQQYITATNRDIIIMGTDAEKLAMPDEKTMNSWIAQVEGSSSLIYQDELSNKPLMNVLPIQGKIISAEKMEKLGLTIWKLSNGVTVILKPTAFKNDEINFTAFSAGGTSLYSNEDYQSAANAAAIVAGGGLGKLDPAQMRNTLNGKLASVSPFIAERTEGISGSTTHKDLETAFQLTYLYFTEPRKDSLVFNTNIIRSKAMLANVISTPEKAFADTINKVLNQGNVRRSGPSLAKLTQLDLNRAFEIYKERFGDASGFTFIFTGSFELLKIKALVEKYLASLPASHQKEKAKDLNIEIPTGVISKTIYSGTEDKATVELVMSGNYIYNSGNNLLLKAVKEIIEFRLVDRLRETEGGVYTPTVQLSLNKEPKSNYAFTIRFGCSPANVEKLIAATGEEINKLKNDGPQASDLDKFKAEEKVVLKSSLETNDFWISYLNAKYVNGEDPEDILSYGQRLERLTNGTIQKAIANYLNNDNYIRFVLLPTTK